MELGHILWPSEPVTRESSQRPGDPVDPVTLFYNELQMSTYVVEKTFVMGKRFASFYRILAFARSQEVKFWRSHIKCQYFNDRWTDFHKKYISLYLYLGLFSKTGKTRVSHRVKMMTRWPERERWPKWPIDPVTRWPSSMSGVCMRSRCSGGHDGHHRRRGLGHRHAGRPARRVGRWRSQTRLVRHRHRRRKGAAADYYQPRRWPSYFLLLVFHHPLVGGVAQW